MCLIASAQNVVPPLLDPITRVDMSISKGIVALVFSAIILSACSFSLAGDVTPPPGAELPVVQQPTQSAATSPIYPIIPPDLVNGAKIYNQECSQCHGTRGLGDGQQSAQLSVPVATLGLSDFARQYSPAEWFNIVTQGKMEKFMPAFANLTDRQRWDVVAYAMSLSAPDALVSQGRALYQQNCASCHGKTGKGNGSEASTFSTQPSDFTNQAFMAQTSSGSLYDAITSGITPDMPAYTSTLNDSQRMALVAYLRSLTYAEPAQSASAYPAPATNLSAISSTTSYPAPQAYPNPSATITPQLETTSEISPSATFVGSVSVQLVNGSGSDAPNDAPVTLYGFDNMQNTFSQTLTTGVGGVYTFLNVVMPEGRAFLAGVDYASATYGSDIAKVDPTTPNLNLQITVYEPTTDVSVLNTDRIHLLFDFSTPGIASIVEVFIISNPSQQAVVSPTEGGTVVTFPLPEGYTNLQFQDGALGDRYVEVSQGFADTTTVNPGAGQYQVIFAYQMPYDRKLNFVQPMFLPTSAVVVMVPDNGIKVDSSMLQDGGTRDYQNTTYRMYNGESLIAGSSLEFTLSGNPKQAGNSPFANLNMQYLAIGLAAFGVALVLGGLWLYRSNQRKAALLETSGGLDLAAPSLGENASPEDEETLMDAIIALDDQYHAGKLPKEAYLERRAILKEKLRRIGQE
jgi:mono/diheme cytochrome c family protein